MFKRHRQPKSPHEGTAIPVNLPSFSAWASKGNQLQGFGRHHPYLILSSFLEGTTFKIVLPMYRPISQTAMFLSANCCVHSHAFSAPTFLTSYVTDFPQLRELSKFGSSAEIRFGARSGAGCRAGSEVGCLVPGSSNQAPNAC